MKILSKPLKLVQLSFIGMAILVMFGCESEEQITPQLKEHTGTASQRASESSKVLRVPSDYTTIQDAVAAAKAGNRIHVSEGVYHHPVHIIGAEKNNLQIIALGKPGSVELVGSS